MKRWLRGSYTIEVACLLLAMFGILTGFLYAGLRLHDRGVIEAVCREAALRGNTQIVESIALESGQIQWDQYGTRSLLWRILESYQEQEREILAWIQQELSGRLLCCGEPIIQVAAAADQIVITYDAPFMLPQVFPDWIFAGFSDSINGSVAVSGLESEEFLRLWKGIIRQ